MNVRPMPKPLMTKSKLAALYEHFGVVSTGEIAPEHIRIFLAGYDAAALNPLELDALQSVVENCDIDRYLNSTHANVIRALAVRRRLG